MNKRTKATSVSSKTRQEVRNRDRWCILCGTPNATDMAHFIPRSSAGKGIEQNLVLLCRSCHYKMDFTSERETLLATVEEYLKQHYENWNKEDLIYRKGENK